MVDLNHIRPPLKFGLTTGKIEPPKAKGSLSLFLRYFVRECAPLK